MGSKGSQTTTTTSAPNPTAMAAYQDILSKAQGVAATPYTPYTGELTAPVNAQQSTGIGNINTNWNYAQPYLQQAAGYATDAATPLTQTQIQQYMSPYTQDVVNATQAQFNNQNEQQRQGVVGNAISHGAMGGNREAIAEAELANQQQLAQAPVIAGLRNQAYSSGLNTALTEQQARAQGAYSLGNLGVSGQNAALTGANAQVGAGTLQQSTQQAQDAAAYQQFVNQLAYPFQTTQWLAGIGTGVGSQMGGTGSTTAPAPSMLGQILGFGAAGLGAAGSAGMFGASGGSPSLSSADPSSAYNVNNGYVPNVNGGGVMPTGNVTYADGGVVGDPAPWVEAKDWVPNLGITPGKGAPAPPKVSPAGSGGSNPLSMLSNMGSSIGKLFGGSGSGAAGADAAGAVGADAAAAGAAEAGGGEAAMEFLPLLLLNRGGAVTPRGVAFADGGTPMAEAPPTNGVGAVMASLPYGGHGWIPKMNMARGRGAPMAPGVAPIAAPSGQSLAQQAKEIGSLANIINNPKSAGSTADDAGFGQSVNEGGGLSASEDNPTIYWRGGQVRRASGGVANLPFHAMVPHLAEGGSPYDTNYFDDTFATPIRHDADSYATLTTPGAMKGYSDRIVADSSYQPQVAELPMPRRRPAGIAPAYDLPPEIMTGRSAPEDQTALGYADDGTVPVGRSRMAPSKIAVVEGDQPSPLDNAAWPQGPRGAPGAGYDAMAREPTGEAPPRSRGVAPSSGINFGADSKLWPSLMSAGFGMMASKSPFLGVAIGEGGQAGMQTYASERQREDRINSEVKKLSQEAEFAQKRLDLATRPFTEQTADQRARSEEVRRLHEATQRQHDRPYTEQTADQKAKDAEAKRYHDLLGNRMQLRPTGTMVETPDGPHPVFIDSRSGMSIDGITGEPVEPNAKIITAPGKAGAVQTLAKELIRDREEQRKTDPSIPALTMEEAVGLAHRSPDADRGTARRLNMAQGAWKAWTLNPINMGKKDAPENKLEFWEQRYGVTGAAPAPAVPGARPAVAPPAPAPAAATAPPPPPRPATVPPDAKPQRNKTTGAYRWVTADGSVYSADGVKQ